MILRPSLSLEVDYFKPWGGVDKLNGDKTEILLVLVIPVAFLEMIKHLFLTLPEGQVHSLGTLLNLEMMLDSQVVMVAIRTSHERKWLWVSRWHKDFLQLQSRH